MDVPAHGPPPGRWAGSPSSASAPDRSRLAALDSMLEPLSIMRSVRDDDGTIVDFEWTYINRAGAAEMMLPVEGLIGSRLLERLPEHRNGLFDTYVRVVETGEPFEVTELGYDDTWETAEVQPKVFDIRAIRVDDGFAVSWNDVTERVANRAALARSEQLFRRAMQDSAVGMTLVTRDGSFVDVNQAMCDFLGHDADTLMAGHWQEFTHPDDVATEETHLRRLLAGEIDTYRITKRYLHADGSVLVGDLSVSGIRNDDGQITGCVRQVIDMTAQARLVEGLATTTRDFQLLADNISDVVVMYGPDGSVQWASPSLKTFLGIDVENVIGKTTPFVHPDDREQALALFRAAIRDQARHLRNRARVVAADGSTPWVDSSIELVWGDDGTLQHEIVLMRDATAEVEALNTLAASEERFRRAMHDAAIGMCLIAPEGTFMEVNPSLCEFFGYDADTLKTKTWQELTHPDDLQVDLEQFHRVIRGEIDTYRLTKRYLAADGSVRVGDLSVSAIRGDDGAVIEFVSQIADMTEQTRVMAELARSEEHFRLLADHTAEVVVRGDTDGVIVWISHSITQARGWLPEDLIGTPFLDLVHPEDVESVLATIPGLQEGIPGRFEVRIRGKDGSHRWFAVTVNPVLDDSGRVTARVTNLRDIDDEVVARDLAARRELEFRQLAEHAADIVIRVGPDNLIDWVSPSVSDLLGWRPAEMVGRRPVDFLAPEDFDGFIQAVQDLQPGVPGRMTARLRAANGDYHWFANTATRIADAAGHELGRVVGMRNIDAEVAAMATLTQSEARAESAMTSAPGGMAMVDLERRFIQVNDAMATMLGRERAWFEGRGIWEILPPEDDIADQQMRSRLHAGDAESQIGERRLLTAEGSVIWVQHAIGLVRDAHGRPRSYVSQFVDITHTKRRAEQLEYLASHDPLTKLPNRRALDRELALLAEAPRRTGPLAALFIDLDQLKPINDELGHAIGDEILVIVAERIRSVLRTDDIVARIGGDEFVALLPSVHDPDDAVAVAEKLRAAVGRDLPDPTWQRVTLSIGVALDTHGSSPGDLLERADLALYRAKHTGRDRTVVYDESMDSPVTPPT